MTGIKIFKEKTHWTAVHNLAFDTVLPRVSLSAWAVLCFILRQTQGYNRRNSALSYPDIMAGTGIKSDKTVTKALNELLSAETFGVPLILRKEGQGHKGATRYALNLNFEVALPSPSPDFCTVKNTAQKIRCTVKNTVHSTVKNTVQKSAPIGSARNPTEESNKESNSLSPRAQDDFSSEEEKTATESPPENEPLLPFIEGQNDARFESEHFAAVCQIAHLDPDLVSWKTKAKAASVAVRLSAKYTPDQIRLCGQRWELPTAPHLDQILDRIGALLAPPKETDHASPARPFAPSPFAPSKFESAAERRGRDLTESLDDLQRRRADLEERKRLLAAIEGGGFGGAGIKAPD